MACKKLPQVGAALALQSSDSNCLNLASVDAEFREITAAWSFLPAAGKNAVLTVVRSFIVTTNHGNKRIANPEGVGSIPNR